MKQIELLPKRAKAKACNWMSRRNTRWIQCYQPSTVQINDAFYCAEHSEKAQKMFGQGKPL